MEKLRIALLCVLGGLAVGAALPTLQAQSHGRAWEQFCDYDGYTQAMAGRNARVTYAAQYNALLANRGRDGWEYVGIEHAGSRVPCFKRPAR